ncbi:hypothetical protein FACS1894200_14090 [Spirochaetia bacterium]|nr:hypothetical protein FACS1894200_14090 [Spirochaetia bacterium]
MKFRIRYSDQIVGVLVVVALVAIIFVIIVLGAKQRWFARDYLYKTYFERGSGLSENMPVQFKGFTIGNIKSFRLTDLDEVEVVFSIYDTYNERVREGALVHLDVSPIGLGNVFSFYSGHGGPTNAVDFPSSKTQLIFSTIDCF